MSLKERLNQEPKKEFKLEKKELNLSKEQNNQNSSKENSLGVIDSLLYDNDINSIFVNGFNSIYIIRNGKTYQSNVTYKNEDEFNQIIKNLVNSFNIELNENKPFALIPYKKGINITLSIPPLVLKPTMTIKCYKDYFATFEELLEDNSLSKEMALVFNSLAFLEENIIISGPKNSCKTALLSALAKKILPNQKALILDYKGEISYENTNCANYNLSKLNDKKTKKELLDSIMTINPDRIFINDAKSEIKTFLNGNYNKMVLNLEANNPQTAINSLVDTVLKLKPYLNYNDAASYISKLFSLIVFLDRDEKGDIKIVSLSEIKEDLNLETIFYINENKDFCSSGVVPKFFKEESENSHLFGANIFDANYRHTKQINIQPQDNIKKNIDLLEKFKKKQDEEVDDDLNLDTSLDDVFLDENDDEQNL